MHKMCIDPNPNFSVVCNPEMGHHEVKFIVCMEPQNTGIYMVSMLIPPYKTEQTTETSEIYGLRYGLQRYDISKGVASSAIDFTKEAVALFIPEKIDRVLTLENVLKSVSFLIDTVKPNKIERITHYENLSVKQLIKYMRVTEIISSLGYATTKIGLTDDGRCQWRHERRV